MVSNLQDNLPARCNMDRKDKRAQQPPTARKLLDSSARRSIVSPHEKDKMQRPMPEQSKESLVNPPHGILAAEALKAPRKISRAAKIMGGIALSTVGVTAASAAGP